MTLVKISWLADNFRLDCNRSGSFFFSVMNSKCKEEIPICRGGVIVILYRLIGRLYMCAAGYGV